MARSNEEPNARSVAATEREKRRAAERLDANAKEDPVAALHQRVSDL
jgi:hypothetical protein